MNKLYEKVKLYFVNKKISKLEEEKDKILSQRKVDIPLQSLFFIGYSVKNISKELYPLYEHKKILNNKLNLSPTGKVN